MQDFFRKNIKKDFFGDFSSSIKPKIYTVIVLGMDGIKREYHGISKPWQYIAKVKKNPSVKSAWIK